ncbi:hypothetical protein ACLOJK_023169 [Asimina triloba]
MWEEIASEHFKRGKFAKLIPRAVEKGRVSALVPSFANLRILRKQEIEPRQNLSLPSLSLPSSRLPYRSPFRHHAYHLSLPSVIDALSHVLRPCSSPSVIQSTVATIYSFLIIDDYRPIIESNFIFPLHSVKDSLKALFHIPPTPPLPHPYHLKDTRVSIVEDATTMTAQVVGCFKSMDGFRKVSGMGILVDLLDPATTSNMRPMENTVSVYLAQFGGRKLEFQNENQSQGSAEHPRFKL